ncbi:hypothetical protein CR532_01020 [Candidatus Borreliella tachyglossi]|uniref:Uncharacterized protein n=1 Tax=Candidatus Borreliella tachyglossi TaxID=1964448 RepID=A0A2S1LWB9_9SPIR|nr:hypothetical protein [Candidatus Borreliella tachyglossi]AWG42593.1 hypothetical protein CR532_01020 [Candidatus Borreliella tachyglossi]
MNKHIQTMILCFSKPKLNTKCLFRKITIFASIKQKFNKTNSYFNIKNLTLDFILKPKEDKSRILLGIIK